MKVNNVNILIVAVIVVVIKDCWSANCGNNDWFGENDPHSKDNDIATTTGIGYMMTDNDFTVDCCGTTKEWEAEFDNTGSGSSSGTVYFQIWRPSGTTYTLMGEFPFPVSSNGEQSLPVDAANRVTVMSGDYVGWWTSGSDLITYKNEGGGGHDGNYYQAQADLAEGATFDWSTGSTIRNDRNYAVKLKVQPSANPSFVSLPASDTIYNYEPSGTSLFTVSVTDTDPDDVASLTVAMSGSTQFSYDSATGVVSTAASFTTSGTVTLSFTVTDQCGKTSTDTVTVTILNEAPVIHSLPASVTIAEDEVAETLLHTINVTDSATSASCSSSTTDPFNVKLIPGGTQYGVYSNSNPGFIFNTQSTYTISVVCTDGDLTDTEQLTVSLVMNQPPVFNNLQGSTVISTSVGIGSNAFTVNVTDVESDSLTYTMTCTPAGAPFQIFASGQIQVTTDLSGQTVVGYDCSVTVSDGRNTVGPEILTITFSDINDNVLISNLPLPAALSIPENKALGYLLYTVSYTDLDTAQPHTFTMTSSPSDGTNYFTIDSSTGVITTAGNMLNYESGTTSYTFTVTVADPVVSDSASLTVDISNVNEAPAFSQDSYILSCDEGTGVIGTPSFSVTDEDASDTHSYTLACGSETGYFSIDQSSAQVSFQGPYDLDTGSRPTSATCTVTVTDSGGLTDTATVGINIGYINDNPPIFSPSSYSAHIDYYAAVGTVVGTVTSTDGDVGADGVQTYTLDQTSLPAEYFTVDSSGVVTLKRSLTDGNINASTNLVLVATASDVGGLSDTANFVIVIGASSTTSTTTTTDRYRTFMEDRRNVTWLIMCVVVLVITCGVFFYIIFTCRGPYSCAQFKRTLRFKRRGEPKKRRRIWDTRERRRRDSHDSRDFALHDVKIRSIRSIEPALPNISSVREPPPPIGLQPWRLQK